MCNACMYNYILYVYGYGSTDHVTDGICIHKSYTQTEQAKILN